MFIRALCASLFALSAFASSALAADLNATPDGTGNCSSEFQACSLATALATSQTGDRVLLYPGQYAVHTTISGGQPGVQVVGAPGQERPVIDATSGRIVLQNGAALSGVDVLANSGTALESDGLIDHVRVTVTGAGSTGVLLHAGATLRNSIVTATGSAATGVRVAATSPAAELRGSTVVASGTGASAVDVGPASPAIISNLLAVNTIFHGFSGALELRVHAGSGETAKATLQYSASLPARQVAQGAGASIAASLGAVTQPPLFADRSAGDYRQQAASPTIDAGAPNSSASSAGTTDFEGGARQLGAQDIGSDERAMPPLILSSAPIYGPGRNVTLRTTVQPRGLATSVVTDWGAAPSLRLTTSPVQISGNSPVVVDLPLGLIADRITSLSVQPRATNSAGTATAPIQLVPVKPVPALPGARPLLVSTQVVLSNGLFRFRLWCRHTISCRGTVGLSGIGTVTPASFKIPPHQARTVRLQLTGKQMLRVRAKGKVGLRGTLHIQSTQDGSKRVAVRLLAKKR